VDSLKIALKHLRNENIRLKSQQLKVRYQMNNKTAEYGKNASSTFVKFERSSVICVVHTPDSLVIGVSRTLSLEQGSELLLSLVGSEKFWRYIQSWTSI